MGGVASVVTTVLHVGNMVMGIIRSLQSQPAHENPVFSRIRDAETASEALENAERAREDAERDAQDAREDAERISRETEAAIGRAQAAQENAERIAREAREESERAVRVARGEAQRAEMSAMRAASALSEQVARVAREVDQERQRASALQEAAKKIADSAKAEMTRMKLVAEEEKKRAEAVRDAAVFAARQADLDANNARKAEKEAERKLREGIQPMVMPTPEDLSEAKRIVNYTEGLFHFAIAGSAGAGKSSLINSFRGLRNLQGGAAATGVVETTLETGRFPDPNPQNPFVWYDIPGAGTLKIPDWQYFNSQGLYVFDCIVVLFDNRFTMTDIAILANCARFDIPTYIVRSKSDVQIRNIMKEMGYDSEEEDRKQRNKLYKLAREQYITETRASVKQNLENANLPEKKVYLVTNDVLLTIVKNNTIPPKMIDELDLMMDLFGEAHTRRCRKSTMSRR